MDFNRMLQYLACPYCKGNLAYLQPPEHGFNCPTCLKHFPIIDDIPRFLEVQEDALRQAKQHWEDSPHFQYEAKTELYSKAYYEEQDRWRQEDVHPFYHHGFQFNSIKNKVILDIGCGSGWVIKQAAKHGAFPIGVDFTEKACLSTKKALDIYELEGLVVQADAQYLPLKSEVIDRVYSIGVLHHIPDTEKGIAEAFRVLRTGGTGLISLYGKLFFFNPVIFPLARFFLKVLLKAPKVRDGIQYTEDYDEFYRFMDGPTNPIGRWYTDQELRTLLGSFDILSMIKSDFPLRYLNFMGISLKRIIPRPIHKFLEEHCGMMRNMQLVKR